jgi:hypothetical protein
MTFLAILIQSSNSSFQFWPVLGAAAGLYLFYAGFRLLQRKRLILDTPASKIRSAAMGLVEVSGLANGPFALIAPITSRPCYFYRTLVWQWERQGKNNTWVKKVDESLHVPFYLDDNTGRVLVNPQGADLDVHCDFKEEFNSSIFSSTLGIPDNITNFLTMRGLDFEKRIKVEEYCIKPKNSLFILGTLARNPGLEVTGNPVRTLYNPPVNNGAFGLSLGSISWANLSRPFTHNSTEPLPAPASQTPRPVLDKAKQDQIAAAMMKAGITNPAAWAAVGVTPLATVANTVAAPAGAAAAPAPALEQFDLHPPAVLMKGAHSSSFLISWKSQRELVSNLSWKSALMIWGGPALTLLSVYFLALQFGWL